MSLNARYGHTNLVARDWRKLAAFYQNVFGCVMEPPERHLSGPAIENGTQVKGAVVTGVHLRLPGLGPEGPTLEIFSYNFLEPNLAPRANRVGYGHIAFMVDDVQLAHDAIVAAGGEPFGDIVQTRAGDRTVTWAYLRDPEGNLLEIQKWT